MNEMNVTEIQDKLVAEVAVILSIDPSTIKPEAPLHTMGIDSLLFVEILVVIENTFNLNLMEAGLSREDFQSIHSLAECISKTR